MPLLDALTASRIRQQVSYDDERALALDWFQGKSVAEAIEIGRLVMLDVDETKPADLSSAQLKTLLSLAWLGYTDLAILAADRSVAE